MDDKVFKGISYRLKVPIKYKQKNNNKKKTKRRMNIIIKLIYRPHKNSICASKE